MISTSTISSFSLLASQTSSVLRSAAFACTFFSTMSFISSSSAASSSAAPTTPAFLSAKIMTKQLNQPLFDPAFVVHMASKPIIQHQDSSLPSLADSIVSSEDFTGKSLFQTLEVEGQGTPTHRPWIVGHRGALFQELENTRAGFRTCAAMGCDAVELDVFLLRCGSLIVFHGGGTDENAGHLLDYCGRDASILDLTYEEALQQLNFNPEYAEFPCPKHSILSGSIPTLEQVLLDAKESGMHVKIELKGEGTVEPSLELVERLGMVEQCSYSSFDLGRIALLRQLRPQTTETGEHVYKTGALFADVPADLLEQAKRAGASEIHLKYDTCTSSIVSQIHNAGFGSLCWFRGPIGMTEDCLEKYWDVGNEDEIMYEAMWKTGVQQLCLNKPDVMIALRNQVLQEMERDVA